MLKGKKILIVTSVNLSANPRSLKEIRSLIDAGADVTVIKFTFNNWSNENELQLEEELRTVRWIKISATRHPYFPWVSSAIVSKLSGFLLKFFRSADRLKAYSLDRRSYLLHKAMSRLEPNYDFIIAHNPGTLWAVSNYATTHNIPYAVDIEDYHAGEQGHVIDETQHTLVNSALRKASYISAASPLILQRVMNDIVTDKPAFVVNNVFPVSIQPVFQDLEIDNGAPLKMIWFSQHLGMDRGIQDAIEAMNGISEFPVTLTLIGNATDDVKAGLQKLLTNAKHTIHYKLPCSEKELFETVSQHHIGLALEPAFSINNDIALSNKILTYLLAGNAIAASDTQAQSLFMNTYPGVGFLYSKGNGAELARQLKLLYADQQSLQSMRLAAYQLAAAELNWEQEQKVFLQYLAKSINN